MKKEFSVFIIFFLSACVFFNPINQPDYSPSENLSTAISLDLPEEWTKTIAKPSFIPVTPIASGTATFLGIDPTQTEADILEPTSTSFEPMFNVATDTLLTMAYGNIINAVNWDGEITTILILDNLINIHMEISPNRKYLAISGTNKDEKPVIIIINLEKLQIIYHKIFDGTIIVDFAWAPDSQNLIASELNYYKKNDFDTALYRNTIDGFPKIIKLSEYKGIVIYQTEWGTNNQIANIEFTCQNAIEVDTGYGDKVKIGQTILGIIDLQTNNIIKKTISDYSEYGTSTIVFSPDGTKIMYLGFDGIVDTGSRKTNQLFTIKDLTMINCPFCLRWSELICTNDYLLVQSNLVGVPGGTIFILNESGDYRKLIEYENIGPHSKIFETTGKTYWIDYQSQNVPNKSIVVTDIHACVHEDANMSTCRQYMLTINGESPDGYNDVAWKIDIKCD